MDRADVAFKSFLSEYPIDHPAVSPLPPAFVEEIYRAAFMRGYRSALEHAALYEPGKMDDGER